MDTAYIKVKDNKPRDLRCRPSIGKHVNNNNKIKTKINFNPLETTGMDALTEVLCKLKELCVCFVGVVVVFVVFMCMLLFDCCVVVAFFSFAFFDRLENITLNRQKKGCKKGCYDRFDDTSILRESRESFIYSGK